MQELAIALVAAVVVLVDQTTKAVALARLTPGGRPRRVVGGLQLTINGRGALVAASGWALVGLWAALVITLLGTSTLSGTWPAAFVVGAALLLGGATGNLIDRRMRRGVVDFLAIGRWPRFNAADVALTGGALLIALGLLAP